MALIGWPFLSGAPSRAAIHEVRRDGAVDSQYATGHLLLVLSCGVLTLRLPLRFLGSGFNPRGLDLRSSLTPPLLAGAFSFLLLPLDACLELGLLPQHLGPHRSLFLHASSASGRETVSETRILCCCLHADGSVVGARSRTRPDVANEDSLPRATGRSMSELQN